MLRRIPLLADTPPKPWACVLEDFTADGRRRVFHGGTLGFAHGAPYHLTGRGRNELVICSDESNIGEAGKQGAFGA